MDKNFNKNDKQLYFNQIRGELVEKNKLDKYCYIVLQVGHENKRHICFNIKKEFYDELLLDKNIGDKVSVRFYLKSIKLETGWITKANVITIEINKDAEIYGKSKYNSSNSDNS